jgi:hypothetical protein
MGQQPLSPPILPNNCHRQEFHSGKFLPLDTFTWHTGYKVRGTTFAFDLGESGVAANSMSRRGAYGPACNTRVDERRCTMRSLISWTGAFPRPAMIVLAIGALLAALSMTGAQDAVTAKPQAEILSANGTGWVNPDVPTALRAQVAFTVRCPKERHVTGYVDWPYQTSHDSIYVNAGKTKDFRFERGGYSRQYYGGRTILVNIVVESNSKVEGTSTTVAITFPK